tara:strand:- start:17 stop:667 length:651 start_codon:yes stop_codon:yes gene_type:complete
MATQVAPTKSKFGIPVDGGTPAGILQPKLKFRFRVTFEGGSFPFGNGQDLFFLTQNVQNVTRPKLTHEEVIIDSYNSKVYVAGKHVWDPVTIIIRDDIRNLVTKRIGEQLQKQVNHFDQTAYAAGDDYKFNVYVEILDGKDADASESWKLEGCFIQNVDYSDTDYSANDPVTITMTLRYDNALHMDDLNTVSSRKEGGDPFPEVSPDANTNSPGLG